MLFEIFEIFETFEIDTVPPESGNLIYIRYACHIGFLGLKIENNFFGSIKVITHMS